MKTKNQTESLKFRREDGEFSNAHNNVLTSKQHRIWKRRNKVKIALVACALAVGIGGGIGAGYAIFNSSTPTKEKKLGIYFAEEMEGEYNRSVPFYYDGSVKDVFSVFNEDGTALPLSFDAASSDSVKLTAEYGYTTGEGISVSPTNWVDIDSAGPSVTLAVTGNNTACEITFVADMMKNPDNANTVQWIRIAAKYDGYPEVDYDWKLHIGPRDEVVLTLSYDSLVSDSALAAAVPFTIDINGVLAMKGNSFWDDTYNHSFDSYINNYPGGSPDTLVFENVAQICCETFYCCRQLTSTDHPISTLRFINTDTKGSITLFIDSSAFSGCKNIQNIEFLSASSTNTLTVSRIADYAFYQCEHLENVKISSNTTIDYIDASVFEDCLTLTSIDLSTASTNFIGTKAFYKCESLTELRLPSAIFQKTSDDDDPSISADAFRDCALLANIYFPRQSTQLSNISIGDYAFYQCAQNGVFFIYSFDAQYNALLDFRNSWTGFTEAAWPAQLYA